MLASLSHFYEEARRFAFLATETSLAESRGRRGVITDLHSILAAAEGRAGTIVTPN